MRPKDVELIGSELAIRWEDASETFIALEKLRRHCPCASCAGEKDILGNVYKGAPRTLTPQAFFIRHWEFIGTYGFKPTWADGHSTGIYSFEYLTQLGEAE